MRPGGPQPSDDPNTLSGVFTSIGTDGTPEKTGLDGRPAAWADGHTLLWAVDNMTFEVGGLDLTLEEAKRIARSLH